MSTTIITKLLAWARRIGRWLIERLSSLAIDHLVGYMLGKLGDFRRRLAKAKTERRRKWLRGRISRWSRAAQWLRTHSTEIGKCTGAEFAMLTERAKGIPIDCERLARAA